MRISDWSSDVCSSDLPASSNTSYTAFAPLVTIFMLRRQKGSGSRARPGFVATELILPIGYITFAKWQQPFKISWKMHLWNVRARLHGAYPRGWCGSWWLIRQRSEERCVGKG